MSASVQDVAYSSDFVENGNARAVRIVPLRDKEFPKSWRCVKPDCRRGAIAASSRHRRGGVGGCEKNRNNALNRRRFISECEKMFASPVVSRFAGGKILL
jgi:hypothetical protein